MAEPDMESHGSSPDLEWIVDETGETLGAVEPVAIEILGALEDLSQGMLGGSVDAMGALAQVKVEVGVSANS